MKVISLCCGLVCLICLFVAYEQYQSNAAAVQFMNHTGGAMMNTMMGGELQAATPASTKYALFFAFIAAVVGVFFYCKKDTGGSAA